MAENVYSGLRQFSYWKAQKLWKLLDKKVDNPVYGKQRACEKINALVVGAGPCGLRSAIELALLGARVCVVEERDKFSRNNVLHLWEFVIHDLKSLGAKIFYPKFCAGSIEHISIRQLQCSLMKTALMFGVQVHESVSFVKIKPPGDDEKGGTTGFRALLEPAGHILSEFDIDVLIGADGKRNTIQGFPRNEMRGRLAIGITANFVNRKKRRPRRGGVAYIFNQEFFKRMKGATGVDLENIVYYKDETHYFVMTAKKQSLLQLGVIKKDHEDVGLLLSPENVNRDALANYAQSAAEFATDEKLPLLEFAKNHRGHPDIAMFDFTSLFSSRCAVRIWESRGKSLLVGIVGDSLHEPFWPTGSGCARGFLGVLDTAWLIREFGLGKRGLLEVLAERESIYRLLAQTTKDNMHKALSKYTIDPRTRYVSLEMTLQPADVVDIICSDNPRPASAADRVPLNRTTSAHEDPSDLIAMYEVLRFVQAALAGHKLKVFDFDLSLRDGRVLAALVAKFRPDLLDLQEVLSMENVQRVEKVFETIEESLDVLSPCTSKYWPNLSRPRKFSYVSAIVEAIRKDGSAVARCLITPRAHSLKRRIIEPLKITVNAKKSGAIAELSASLFGRSFDDALIVSQAVDEQQRHEERLTRIKTEIRLERMPETSPSKIEKLNPDLVEKVKKIVSGEKQKENLREMYDKKQSKTGRLDPSEIATLENRLNKSPTPTRAEHLSSQEEKILRAKAADARKEAASGFSREYETLRFEKYDKVINESEKAAKRRELVGIDPFNRQRRATTAIVFPNGASTSSAVPNPPVKSFTVENGENGVVFRPIASVEPKRQTSMVETAFDSLNPRKQETCKLCEKVVYLAERVQVGTIFVHRNCFRCAYCSQPLRIGAYCTDKDLEYHYPNRLFYYCRTHMQIPLREKISKIGRVERAIQRKKSSEDEESSSATAKQEQLEEISVQKSSPSEPELTAVPRQQSTTTLNFFSPEQMRTRAEQKIKNSAMASMITSPGLEVGQVSQNTPERAEFGAHIRNSRPSSSALNYEEAERVTLTDSTSDSEDEEEEELSGIINDPVASEDEAPTNEAVPDEEDVEDELEDEDLAEVERTFNEILEQHPDQQFDSQADKEVLVKTALERINHRRSVYMTPSAARYPPKSLKTPRQSSIQNEDLFFTPAVSFRKPKEEEEDDESRNRAVSIAVDSEIGNYELYMTPCAANIQQEKMNELEKLRSEARQRAKLKTDEQLGIESTSTKRSSLEKISSSVEKSAGKVTARASTVSPPTNRGKKVTEKAVSLLDDMPSMRRTSSGRDTAGMTLVEEVTPKTPPVPSSEPPMIETPVRRPIPPPPVAPSQGLLSKLFSPNAIRKVNLLDPDRLHCESKREVKMLENPVRKMRLKRSEVGPPPPPASKLSMEKPLSTICDPNGKVPCVAVAPSPRKTPTPIGPSTSTSVHPASDERTASPMMSRNESDRAAQLIQKHAEKNDSPTSGGTSPTGAGPAEKFGGAKLRLKPRDSFMLDCWNALVQEQKFLKWRQECLMLRKQQFELERKYKELNEKLNALNDDDDGSRRAELLEQMLEVVAKKKEIKTRVDVSNSSLKSSRPSAQDLVDAGYDFRRLQPVFSPPSNK
ncbi:unnamed protein product [Caenorhabditis auriculariae]|uniref:F-actin monooxygenase n=1 Tax=Caenorhabditis auriculariae TaxID=2777116 RepID=A0A8S1HMJ0_9PELO|nr:unnamed protein product [Caenorhabditis auriculariae]